MFEPRKPIVQGKTSYDEEDATEYTYEIEYRGNQIIVTVEGEDIQRASKNFEVFIGPKKTPESKSNAYDALEKGVPVMEEDYRVYMDHQRGINKLCKLVLEDAGFRVENQRTA